MDLITPFGPGNLISGNIGSGISIGNAGGIKVLNNLIGVNATNDAVLPNGGAMGFVSVEVLSTKLRETPSAAPHRTGYSWEEFSANTIQSLRIILVQTRIALPVSATTIMAYRW